MAPEGASKPTAAPSPIHQLNIKAAFESLSPQEKLYAHHLARAAWHGARIIMRQVSPEAVDIYEFILELYSCCAGKWQELGERCQVESKALDAWLEYAAKFLSNVGNYYGSGDQKFVPEIDARALQKLASASARALEIYRKIEKPIFEIPPYSLGFPDDLAQSAYYPGTLRLSKDEIAAISQAMERESIFPENTRIRKVNRNDQAIFEVLQASVEQDQHPQEFKNIDADIEISLVRGDHAQELAEICSCLSKASQFTPSERQKEILSQYIQSFKTGNLETYRDSQRTWVTDLGPRVENIFGFVEPYRDPYGTRAEFEGLVAISDQEETKALKRLVDNSAKFIRRLPWAVDGGENDGKGPFEKALFEPPDFASIHSLAYCSSIIFPGINLPNYNDIRQDCGFKNVIIANRMSVESNSSEISPFVDPAEAETFQKHKFNAYYLWVVLHELVGHGTGKMMVEETAGKFNFDFDNPPNNPLSDTPISSWYKPGQTWTGQFGDLATTVDECRAELVGAYLMDNIELLGLFGFSETSEITAADLTYNTYLQLGIDGIRGLQNYNHDSGVSILTPSAERLSSFLTLFFKKWGQAHSRAHFAILKCMLTDGNGFLNVDCDPTQNSLIVHVERDKILSHGKPALGRMLLRLHMYRCTADVKACRTYYEDLSKVEGRYLEWREVVLAQKQPKWTFVHANTFLDGEAVTLKEYNPTKEGIIQSWAERQV